ncbi:MAG: hypothetical protein U1E56_04250 [Bauldia sp.]
MTTRKAFGLAVLAVFLVSAAVWAAMAFGTLAHLRRLAGGLAPLDLQPFGYRPADVNALLTALGEEGRRFYADVQLRIDAVYPALYALSRALLIWWLTEPGRLGRDAALPLRLALLAAPLIGAGLDYVENSAIAAILAAPMPVDRVTVGAAALATEMKSVAVTFTEVVCLALGAAAAWHWWQGRRPASPSST